MTQKPYLLCVLDGFGLNPNPEANAIKSADTPVFDHIWEVEPHTTLTTHGERVGLPAGQMGNSEVGHLNIGAGREVKQWLLYIAENLNQEFLKESKSYNLFLDKAKQAPRIHFIGLYSDGGVHSHCEHLHKFMQLLSAECDSKLCLHFIADGRDTATDRSIEQIDELQNIIDRLPNACIATVSGRYYAMDRDSRWDRTALAYQAIAQGEGPQASSAREALEASHKEGVTDEFIIPTVIQSEPFGKQDCVVFWNFRADRMRQIVRAVSGDVPDEFEPHRTVIDSEQLLCFTEYDKEFGYPVLFPPQTISNSIGEVVSNAGLKQLRVAETEKYPHVTYFLNGGVETEYPGEDRKLLPSPRDVATYDLKPEMSALAVRDTVVDAIKSGEYGLIVVNFANCDMVGHTGVFDAAVKAVETVDSCLGKILSALQEAGGTALVLADHGNADQMIDYETGAVHTAHTTHPVPLVAIGAPAGVSLAEGGALCDVAPTLLELMGLAQPAEMTGRSLILE